MKAALYNGQKNVELVELATPQAGENAIVFGAGTIGIAAAIALKYFGCDKVMICDHSDFRLNKAKELGFEICNNGKENLKTKALQIFGSAMSALGETCDVDISRRMLVMLCQSCKAENGILKVLSQMSIHGNSFHRRLRRLPKSMRH